MFQPGISSERGRHRAVPCTTLWKPSRSCCQCHGLTRSRGTRAAHRPTSPIPSPLILLLLSSPRPAASRPTSPQSTLHALDSDVVSASGAVTGRQPVMVWDTSDKRAQPQPPCPALSSGMRNATDGSQNPSCRNTDGRLGSRQRGGPLSALPPGGIGCPVSQAMCLAFPPSPKN